MSLPVFDLEGKEVGKIELPKVFSLNVREDLIERAFWILFTHRLQPKGTDPLAGERTSAESRGTGLGIARLARVKGERHPRAGQAAGVAGVVKGRIAHPPKAEKVIRKEINKKERLLALAHAIAATSKRDLVKKRGHRIDNVKALPIVVTDEIQKVKKAKELASLLEKLGLKEEMERIKKGIKRTSGTSRRRGRTKKVPKGPLLVIKEDEGIVKACGSLAGVDCVKVKDLSVLDLAPGGKGGRLTIWSESAIKNINEKIYKLPALIGV
ncbi:hypothetical protein HRbin06_00069 [archaeon HR06]|nr:hypothetical protein HRbin06_00069 [archaeon HR06]